VGSTSVTLTSTDQNNVNFGTLFYATPVPVGTSADIYGPASTDPIVRYVHGLYHNILNRDGEAKGVAFWAAQLHGGAALAAVVQGFLNSVEHRGIEVDSYYRVFLGREADAFGRLFWVNQLLSGVDERVVVQGFLTSAEFVNAHSDTNSYVTALYAKLLGRAPDAAGMAVWVSDLNGGANRADVVNGFLFSSEEATLATFSFYAAYLHRRADDVGTAFWIPLLQSPSVPIGMVIQGFLTSAEYVPAG
jgi:hypothetical protein